MQKYIERPLVIDGRKGDFRLWIVVTSWNPAMVWAWSERDDQLEGNPWQQDTEEVDSDADPPRQDEVARPSASIGMVLYHRLAEEDDQGYHRQRQPLRGTPTLFTLPRYNEHGLETYRERATYKYLYETCTRYAPEPYHPAAHRDPPLQQPYQPRSSSHFPPPYQIPARRPDNYQVRGRGSRHGRRRIQNRQQTGHRPAFHPDRARRHPPLEKIGRASCRERV